MPGSRTADGKPSCFKCNSQDTSRGNVWHQRKKWLRRKRISCRASWKAEIRGNIPSTKRDPVIIHRLQPAHHEGCVLWGMESHCAYRYRSDSVGNFSPAGGAIGTGDQGVGRTISGDGQWLEGATSLCGKFGNL